MIHTHQGWRALDVAPRNRDLPALGSHLEARGGVGRPKTVTGKPSVGWLWLG
ncbi:MAG: hypothetical protein Q6L68_10180 [Thermostichus sp. DG02_5_bins_236]